MTWSLDASHSGIEFGVRHMGISTVRGRFKEFEVDVELADDGAPERISATLQAASIDTGVAQRDEHLRSADFFDVEQYPTIEFRSTAIEPAGDNTYRVTGDFTMRGVTKPLSFELETADEVIDPWGNRRVAGTVSGTLNRKDLGLTWNQVLEFGALLVSEDVRFTIEIQVVAPQEAAAAA